MAAVGPLLGGWLITDAEKSHRVSPVQRNSQSAVTAGGAQSPFMMLSSGQ